MISPAGEILTWNLGVERLLGYSEEQFIGKKFDAIFTAEDQAAGAPQKELKTAQHTGRAEDSRWHQRRDGSRFWANGALTAMRDDDQKITGFAKIMRDQTEKRLLEERLAQSTESLTRANKELNSFADVLVHDLQAPLQTMCGFAHVLKENPELDAEAVESVNFIVDGAERLVSLVKEVQQYSKSPRDSEARKTIEICDAEKVLQGVLQDLQSQIQDRQAKIVEEVLPEVRVNKVQLARVLQNLIQNAIKYCPDSRTPEIHISTRQENAFTRITIRDNGIGIAKKDLPKIFTLFERLREDLPGRGIGLAVCRKLVEEWGGSIHVESEPGRGSIFSFTIPNTENISAVAGHPAAQTSTNYPQPVEW